MKKIICTLCLVMSVLCVMAQDNKVVNLQLETRMDYQREYLDGDAVKANSGFKGSLGNAIGVIMGANIGTTLTAWITSLGFSVNIALFAVPMMGIGYLMHSSKKATLKNVGQFLMGFAVMYVGLTFMKDCSNAVLGQYNTGMMDE